jgi:sugar phosphate permease
MRARLTAPNIVLSLLCLMYLVLYIDRVNIATAAPFIRRDLGLSNAEYGIAFSAFFIPYAGFQLAGGWLGDTFGARRVLGVSLVMVCIATFFTGMVGGLATLFAARFALGICEGSALPTATRAMANWTPASRWGFAQGITHSFARLGNFVTPPIVATLILWFSWRESYFILAGISLVWTAIWLWYFRDSPADHPHVTPEDLKRLPPKREKRAKDTVPWFRLFGHIYPATIVNFFYGWALFLFLTWIPSYFVENFGLDIRETAIMSSGVFFGGVVGDTLGGWVSDRLLKRTGNLVFARRSVIVTGFTGAAVFFLPVIFVHDPVTAAICLSAAFFFAELVVAPIWAVPMDMAPRYAGSASGMMNFGSASAGIISPPIFGYLVDVTGGWTIPLSAVAILLLMGAVSAFALRPDKMFEDNEEPLAGAALKPAE